MTEAMYDPQDKPLATKVTRGNLAVNKPEAVTVTGYEANVNGAGQSVLRLVCYPVGKPSFQEAIVVTSDHLAPLMTAEQYDALEKQSMNSCDIDIELVKVAGFSLNPYRISKVLRGEIVAKKQEKAEDIRVDDYDGPNGMPHGDKEIPENKPLTEEQQVKYAQALKTAMPAQPSDNIDDYLKLDDKPKCLNDWALDHDKRGQFMQRVDGMAFEAMIDPKNARAWALALLNVPDETQITTSASEALKVIKATLPKSEPAKEPEPKRAEPEKPIQAIDMQTGEILDAALIPYEPVKAAVERVKTSTAIMRGVQPLLAQGIDFGVIPGTGTKPVLLKPGAEKLCNAFNLCPEFELADAVKQWDADKPLFYFQYRCKLIDIATGKVIATGLGSCNSMESKYRWRWLWKNQVDDLGIDTEGLVTRKTQKGSIQYRVPNDDMFSQINTLDKMAQKRALIAAVLIGCNASRDYTQDLEEQD